MPLRACLKGLFGGHKTHSPSTIDTRSLLLQSVSPASDPGAESTRRPQLPTASANDTPVVDASSAQDTPSFFKKFNNLTAAKVCSRRFTMAVATPPPPSDLSVHVNSTESQLQTPISLASHAPVVGGNSVQVDPSRVDTPSIPPALFSTARDPPVAKSITGSGIVIENIAITIGLVEKAADLLQTLPFIAPVASLMSEILKAYKVRLKHQDSISL
jgi:hypothetical protein